MITLTDVCKQHLFLLFREQFDCKDETKDFKNNQAHHLKKTLNVLCGDYSVPALRMAPAM